MSAAPSIDTKSPVPVPDLAAEDKEAKEILDEFKEWVINNQTLDTPPFHISTTEATGPSASSGRFTARYVSIDTPGFRGVHLDNTGVRSFWAEFEVKTVPGPQTVKCNGRFDFSVDGKILSFDDLSLVFTPDTKTASLVSSGHPEQRPK
jgi:hypothetical protein